MNPQNIILINIIFIVILESTIKLKLKLIMKLNHYKNEVA